MVSNPINPFEYVSILISIILGLGITQILSSFSDLIYHHKKGKILPATHHLDSFFLFLHIQDWLFKKITHEALHKLFAIFILMAVMLSVVLEKSVWVIK